MKARKLIVTGCACVLSFALLTGCGNNAESTNGDVQIDDVQVDESVEAETEGENTETNTENQNADAENSDQPMMMKVVSIDGNQITATVMKQNSGRGQGQKPDGEAPAGENGEMPEKPDGEAPQKPDGEAPAGQDGETPQKPDGEAPVGQDGEAPQKPDGEAPAGQDGEKPQKPDGEAPQGDVSGNNPGRGEMETITFTITDTTQITQESEDGNTEATADQITTDSMLQVELNENNEAVSIVIRTMPEAK